MDARMEEGGMYREVRITAGTGKIMKELRSLLGGRGIRRHGRALVSGEKAIRDLVRLRPELIEAAAVPDDWRGQLPVLPGGTVTYRLSRELFRELDVHGTAYPLLAAATPDMQPLDADEPADILLLVPFQDPSNVGAVIRSAAAFGIECAVLLEEAANPFLPRSIRAAGPHVFTISWRRGPSIRDLGGIGRPLVALAAEGEDIERVQLPPRFALLPGMEGPGVPDTASADITVAIPMEPHVESLNAAVAVSIALYRLYRRR